MYPPPRRPQSAAMQVEIGSFYPSIADLLNTAGGLLSFSTGRVFSQQFLAARGHKSSGRESHSSFPKESYWLLLFFSLFVSKEARMCSGFMVCAAPFHLYTSTGKEETDDRILLNDENRSQLTQLT